MSEVDDSEDSKKKLIDTLPQYNIRFTSITSKNADDIIRSTYRISVSSNPVLVFAEAMTKYTAHKDIAEFVKREADCRHVLNTVPGKGPWHCVIGKGFAVAVGHERGHAVMLDLPTLGISVCVFMLAS